MSTSSAGSAPLRDNAEPRPHPIVRSTRSGYRPAEPDPPLGVRGSCADDVPRRRLADPARHREPRTPPAVISRLAAALLVCVSLAGRLASAQSTPTGPSAPQPASAAAP